MDRSKGCRFYDETYKDFKDNSAIIFFSKDNDCESQNKHIDIKKLSLRENFKKLKVSIELNLLSLYILIL